MPYLCRLLGYTPRAHNQDDTDTSKNHLNLVLYCQENIFHEECIGSGKYIDSILWKFLIIVITPNKDKQIPFFYIPTRKSRMPTLCVYDDYNNVTKKVKDAQQYATVSIVDCCVLNQSTNFVMVNQIYLQPHYLCDEKVHT